MGDDAEPGQNHSFAMQQHPSPRLLLTSVSIFCGLVVSISDSRAASAREINSESRAALQQLYSSVPAARRAGDSAAAVLVFPSILKAGFVFGGQRGEGTLFSHGKTLG